MGDDRRMVAEPLHALTGLRGVFALWVFALHAAMLFRLGIGHDTTAVWGAWLVPVVWSGYLGVDGFFILSGFVMSLVYSDRLLVSGPDRVGLREFYAARVARIYPLHLAVLLLLMILVYLVGLEPAKHVFPPDPAAPGGGDSYAPGDLLRQLLLIHAWDWWPRLTWSQASWSISAEAAMYGLFPLVLLGMRRVHGRVIGVAGAIACIGAALAVSSWSGVGARYVAGSFATYQVSEAEYAGAIGRLSHMALEFGVIRACGGFLAGCLLYRAWRTWPYHRMVVGLCLALALAVGATGVFVGPVWLVNVAMVPGILALTWPHSVAARTLASRPLVWLGDRSYSIYLMHGIGLGLGVMLATMTSATPFEDWSSSGLRWWLLAVVIGVLALSDASYRWLERPLRAWLRRRLAGPTLRDQP